MTEESAFSVGIRVVTKSYGILNDPDMHNELFQKDQFAPKEVRSVLLSKNSKFVTSGSGTFLVGSPEQPYGGVLYSGGFDTNTIQDEIFSEEIWIPVQEIICIIPSPIS